VSILVVGLSHHTAPVSVLERAALTGEPLAKLLTDLVESEHVTETVVLSTCNRVEVYAVVEKFHGGVAVVSELLGRHTGVGLDPLTPHLYVHYDDRAVQHLFNVACGLDSMVVGEGQILGQVRSALALAQELGTAGRLLNELVQQALRVGKRAHTETGIDRAGQSLVSVALEEARSIVGSLTGAQALVVGAGSMSALAAATLHRIGAGEIVVANRTYDRGARVAAVVHGRAVRLESFPAELAGADVVVSCTGAAGTVISATQVADAVAARGGRPLVLLDLALPRDIDPTARSLAGVTLVDLERLAEHGDFDRTVAGDVAATRRIVADEVAAFSAWQRSTQVAPTVVALRTMAADLVAIELARLEGRLPGLDDRARTEVANTVRRVVEKLLHAPTVRVKELAGDPQGQSYAHALRELFDLDLETVEAVTRAEVPAERRSASETQEGPR
jgi:glutamyl-tRNA reductase